MSAAPSDDPRRVVLRQVAAVVRLELRRRFLGRHSLGLYLLAILPTVPFILRAVFLNAIDQQAHLATATAICAQVFQTLVLRVVLFIGTVSTFVNLFRGDELERVLHLYFLAPLRRRTLVVAKYCAGTILCGIPFTGTVVVTYVALYIPHGIGATVAHAGELGWYLVCAWLAIAGYGAVALLCGLMFSNGMLPALVLWGWEFLNPVLPSVLKHFSVLYWVESLLPVHPSQGPLAVLAESAPAYVAIPCVLALAAALVAVAGWRIARHEVRYAAD